MYYESSIESGSLDVRRKEMGESFCLKLTLSVTEVRGFMNV